ncbi:hypothetical protein [Paracraurococcus lichenis]|uniref:Uncharacterized protein n=1 Tax=Paracraurococcus lichenis TaxID=3064888 RepID=A0ABT9EAW6_9PROT|nr:hypothetical protein [Paracraurococcus sp. LOR1-02]MDO9713314.1 hypothetical protein [Paracraurococcus sp. LOR1-02]
MTHTALIQGTDHLWGVTLPDYIHLSQGPVTDTGPFPVFIMDGGKSPNTPPLTIDIHYTPEAIFQDSIASIRVQDLGAEGLAAETPAANFADSTNGLRGSVQFVLHNDTGIPIIKAPIGQGGDMLLYLTGFSDNTSPTQEFHTPYTHFHAPTGKTLAEQFPGADIQPMVGYSPNSNEGNPVSAPDTISISQAIPVGGTVTWGPMTMHQRDLSQGADDFTISFYVNKYGFNEADFAQLKADWDAAHKLPTLDTHPTLSNEEIVQIFTNPDNRPIPVGVELNPVG